MVRGLTQSTHDSKNMFENINTHIELELLSIGSRTTEAQWGPDWLAVEAIKTAVATPAIESAPPAVAAAAPHLVPVSLDEGCPRCGSREFRDFPIHSGTSIRRDCRCGRTLDFPIWAPEGER